MLYKHWRVPSETLQWRILYRSVDIVLLILLIPGAAAFPLTVSLNAARTKGANVCERQKQPRILTLTLTLSPSFSFQRPETKQSNVWVEPWITKRQKATTLRLWIWSRKLSRCRKETQNNNKNITVISTPLWQCHNVGCFFFCFFYKSSLCAAGGDSGWTWATAAGEAAPGGAGDPTLEAPQRAGGELSGGQTVSGQEGLTSLCHRAVTHCGWTVCGPYVQ